MEKRIHIILFNHVCRLQNDAGDQNKIFLMNATHVLISFCRCDLSRSLIKMITRNNLMIQCYHVNQCFCWFSHLQKHFPPSISCCYCSLKRHPHHMFYVVIHLQINNWFMAYCLLCTSRVLLYMALVVWWSYYWTAHGHGLI